MTTQFTFLSDWLSWLETLHPTWMDLGLERIATVAKRLQLGSFPCPVITVTGTNGKGSTVALLETIYLQAGYKVGAYTSPHLLRFNERIRIQGSPVSDAALCTAFAKIEQQRQNTSLTYFEFTTLAAFELFNRAQLDVLILEVGLGGRLDAVNVVDADLAIITTVALDHEAWLGSDTEAIGYEKAGIMRAHKPVVCGDLEPPQSVLAQAQNLAASFYGLGQDFQYQQLGDTWQLKTNQQIYENLPIPTILLQNAATALKAVEILQETLPVNLVDIKQALQQVSVPGRFQIVPGPITTILDVAHNPAAGASLAQRLAQESQQGRIIAVFSMLADKNIVDTLRPLVPQIQAWFTGPLSVARAASGEQLAEALEQAGAQQIQAFKSFSQAYAAALSYAQQGDKLLVFGSFYAVAQVLQALNISAGDT